MATEAQRRAAKKASEAAAAKAAVNNGFNAEVTIPPAPPVARRIGTVGVGFVALSVAAYAGSVAYNNFRKTAKAVAEVLPDSGTPGS